MTNDERIERLESLVRALSDRLLDLSNDAMVRRNVLALVGRLHTYPHPMERVEADREKMP